MRNFVFILIVESRVCFIYIVWVLRIFFIRCVFGFLLINKGSLMRYIEIKVVIRSYLKVSYGGFFFFIKWEIFEFFIEN